MFEAHWIAPDPDREGGYLVVPEVREEVIAAEGGIEGREPVPFAVNNQHGTEDW